MTLDATVAGASANSYLEVAEADAMAADDLGAFAEHWGKIPQDVKERALIRASREVAGRYGPTIRYAADQALAFPRSIDYTGTPAAPFLHGSLKFATYEQAIFIAKLAETLDAAATRRAQGQFSASDDNGSWSLAADPLSGRMAPEAIAAIQVLRGATGPTPRLRSVQLSSSFPT